MSTATAITLQQIEPVLAAKGGDVLDAPVCGGTTRAAQSTPATMAGGDPAVRARCRLVLKAMGSCIL